MALPVKFDHCVVHVSDFERSNPFYRDENERDRSVNRLMRDESNRHQGSINDENQSVELHAGAAPTDQRQKEIETGSELDREQCEEH